MSEDRSFGTVSTALVSIVHCKPWKDETEDVFVCHEDLIARLERDDSTRKWDTSDFPGLLEAYQRFLERNPPSEPSKTWR